MAQDERREVEIVDGFSDHAEALEAFRTFFSSLLDHRFSFKLSSKKKFRMILVFAKVFIAHLKSRNKHLMQRTAIRPYAQCANNRS
jgi:hypothetical protein